MMDGYSLVLFTKLVKHYQTMFFTVDGGELSPTDFYSSVHCLRLPIYHIPVRDSPSDVVRVPLPCYFPNYQLPFHLLPSGQMIEP